MYIKKVCIAHFLYLKCTFWCKFLWATCGSSSLSFSMVSPPCFPPWYSIWVHQIPWLICERLKGFLILVSPVLFTCVSRYYSYQQWDELVNVQPMIEDIYIRKKFVWAKSQYIQEQTAFLTRTKITMISNRTSKYSYIKNAGLN